MSPTSSASVPGRVASPAHARARQASAQPGQTNRTRQTKRRPLKQLAPSQPVTWQRPGESSARRGSAGAQKTASQTANCGPEDASFQSFWPTCAAVAVPLTARATAATFLHPALGILRLRRQCQHPIQARRQRMSDCATAPREPHEPEGTSAGAASCPHQPSAGPFRQSPDARQFCRGQNTWTSPAMGDQSAGPTFMATLSSMVAAYSVAIDFCTTTCGRTPGVEPGRCARSLGTGPQR